MISIIEFVLVMLTIIFALSTVWFMNEKMIGKEDL